MDLSFDKIDFFQKSICQGQVKINFINYDISYEQRCYKYSIIEAKVHLEVDYIEN